MEDKIVTLARFSSHPEYYVIQSRLESEGIEVFLGDDYSVSINPFISNATGGIKLNVRASQAEEALAVLKDFNENKQEQEDENEIMVQNRIFIKTFNECPKCESENVFYEKHSFFKSIFTNFIKREHYCADCKHYWFQQI